MADELPEHVPESIALDEAAGTFADMDHQRGGEAGGEEQPREIALDGVAAVAAAGEVDARRRDDPPQRARSPERARPADGDRERGSYGGRGDEGRNGDSFPRKAVIRQADDWDCPSCKEMNFSYRIECYRCRAPRPEGMGAPVGSRRAPEAASWGVGGMPRPGPRDRRPGDWDCRCGNYNFARRDTCNKCHATRDNAVPEGGGAAAGPYGGGGGYGGYGASWGAGAGYGAYPPAPAGYGGYGAASYGSAPAGGYGGQGWGSGDRGGYDARAGAGAYGQPAAGGYGGGAGYGTGGYGSGAPYGAYPAPAGYAGYPPAAGAAPAGGAPRARSRSRERGAAPRY